LKLDSLFLAFSDILRKKGRTDKNIGSLTYRNSVELEVEVSTIGAGTPLVFKAERIMVGVDGERGCTVVEDVRLQVSMKARACAFIGTSSGGCIMVCWGTSSTGNMLSAEEVC
jgi:hypothetical protein